MTYSEFVFYQKEMMKILKAPGSCSCKPRHCWDCEYHQPEWKYRCCIHLFCPYKNGRSTIRDSPLSKHPFDNEEVLAVSGV